MPLPSTYLSLAQKLDLPCSECSCGLSSKFWPEIPFLNIHQWTFEMLCGLEFRDPPSPSEQARMRAWKTSQADFAFCLELVLEWSFGESSGSGMKVTCCWRCFTDANAFGEPVQTHPKRPKSKIWGLSAIASHRESLATMISDPDAFPPPDFWMDFGFSWVVACWPDIPFLNIHQWTFEMLCGLEFRGPPSPSEQARMRAWKTSQADFAFCLELVLEWSFGESSGSGMKVTCCWRCFTDANAFGEPVQTHPKRSKSKILGLSAIASHRESLATMISDPDAFPPPDFWMDFGFSWVVACWLDIPFLNIHQWTFEMLCGCLGVLLVLLNRQGCEHGRPARQTLHSVWNWFWNDLLGNPVGLEWKSHAAGDASLTQMLLRNQFRPIPKGLSLRFGDCQR